MEHMLSQTAKKDLEKTLCQQTNKILGLRKNVHKVVPEYLRGWDLWVVAEKMAQDIEYKRAKGRGEEVNRPKVTKQVEMNRNIPKVYIRLCNLLHIPCPTHPANC